jgi:hypothetical protein
LGFFTHSKAMLGALVVIKSFCFSKSWARYIMVVPESKKIDRPSSKNSNAFLAMFNFYNVHYASTHIVGTSGGNMDDMIESLKMMEEGKVNPASMVTHIGGLDCAAETTLNLPNIPGGKKLIYTHIEMPLTAIADFEKLGEGDEMFKKLAEITAKHNGLWSAEAEKYLLEVKGAC